MKAEIRVFAMPCERLRNERRCAAPCLSVLSSVPSVTLWFRSFSFALEGYRVVG